jgi:ribosomal 50S subunit-associated protein YjgA (DUF615 family)
MFEQNSRENFEEAQKKAEQTEEKINEAEERNLGTITKLFRDFKDDFAKWRVEKIYGKSQEEAEALNEKHEQLRQNVLDAVEALDNFERDELGMKEKKEN